MMIHMKQVGAVLVALFTQYAYADVGQILTDYFFQNPAELEAVSQQKMVLGNAFIAPTLTFHGTTLAGTGQAQTSTFDTLPYVLADTRLTDKWVLGFNIVPCQYGDLQWPIDSIVAHDSTTTKVYYYRLGFQSSYQLNPHLDLGIGVGLEYNYLQELDAVVRDLGNEVNKVSAVTQYMDAGFVYHITPRHALLAAMYSPVNIYGKGTSTLGGMVSNNFKLNIVDAAVLYMGLQHTFSEQWFLEERIYWSQWSAQQFSNLENTTRGNLLYITDWKDTLSYQLSGQYTSSEKLAWLATVMYETNAAPLWTNAIAYPIAPSWYFSLGLDRALTQNIHVQLFYGFSTFIPKAQIDTGGSIGMISCNTQSGVLQLTYKN